MAERVYALVKPELLVWARESAGFSREEVAHKLNVKLQKLEDWEKGNNRPTIKQLRKLGQVYKRPLAVFYLPERPKDFQPLRDFRRIAKSVGFKQSTKLNFEIRNAIFRRQSAINLFEDLYNEIPRFLHEIDFSGDPEQIGAEIRKILGITYKEQSEWSSGHEAFNKWRSAVENTGVLVFQSFGIYVSEMRGFSISEFPLPVIVLNVKDSPKGRIFTLLHELTHIMLKESGICDLHEDDEHQGERIEIFCNRVAGAALVTKQALLHEAIVKSKGRHEWDDRDLGLLSRKFNVSKEVVLRRLLINGLTSRAFYLRKRDEFIEEYEKLKEQKTGGFLLPHVKTISSAGLTFVRLVLNSYYQEKITSSDLSDYLDIKLNYLPKIEAEMKSKSVKFEVLS